MILKRWLKNKVTYNYNFDQTEIFVEQYGLNNNEFTFWSNKEVHK